MGLQKESDMSEHTHTHTGMLAATAVITGGNEKAQGAAKSEKRKH